MKFFYDSADLCADAAIVFSRNSATDRTCDIYSDIFIGCRSNFDRFICSNGLCCNSLKW